MAGVLEQRHQRQHQQNNNNPQSHVAQIGVHPASFMVRQHAA